MIQSKNLLNQVENVTCVSYTKDFLYNILMEKHDIINVNNMKCETLHPLNPIARLYNYLYNVQNIKNIKNVKNNKKLVMHYT